jgi:hypothetical protein
MDGGYDSSLSIYSVMREPGGFPNQVNRSLLEFGGQKLTLVLVTYLRIAIYH